MRTRPSGSNREARWPTASAATRCTPWETTTGGAGPLPCHQHQPPLRRVLQRPGGGPPGSREARQRHRRFLPGHPAGEEVSRFLQQPGRRVHLDGRLGLGHQGPGRGHQAGPHVCGGLREPRTANAMLGNEDRVRRDVNVAVGLGVDRGALEEMIKEIRPRRRPNRGDRGKRNSR